jgi:hypothetical protein
VRCLRSVSANVFYLIIVLGLPLGLLLIAMLAGRAYRDQENKLLDWEPTRSPAREVELASGETQQMLSALNRYRRLRGLPERSLEEITEHGWAGLDEQEDAP